MNLSELDLSTLSDKEKIQLFPFYDAWRPFPVIVPTRKELKHEGSGYFMKTKTLDEIKHQASMMDQMYYTFLENVTRDENGNIVDDDE